MSGSPTLRWAQIYVPRIPGMAPFTDTPDKYSLNFEVQQADIFLLQPAATC